MAHQPVTTPPGAQAGAAFAARIADRLSSPQAVRAVTPPRSWWPQSLAYGAAGIALLHIERARLGEGSWQRAHDWLACTAAEPAVTGAGSHLYYGAPALAFALHAAVDRPGRYARALEILDRHTAVATRSRLNEAHARIDRGELPALAEFDAIRGLTGMGALLLRRSVHHDDAYADLVREVLAYLVRLSRPVRHHGHFLPGWWSELAPSGKKSAQYPSGHANHGVAHGIAGPLALLALASLRGITVSGHREAIGRICDWLDRWRIAGPDGPYWPYWITLSELESERPSPGPARPSWCYGVAGSARAQQLAALATGDTGRQRMAEEALLRAMTARTPLAATTDLSLCHGFAGLAHIVPLAATDAITPGLSECLARLLAPIESTGPDTLIACGAGLLEGAAGVALALLAQVNEGALSGWDSCFLIA
ncbi:lanthionine synthetase C family protein [Actinomadura sp. 21ATH]|uniref:lanthionine synthetase C family protein n=1 Tax=Actinomadura sp. 21ATH TaxID=1735444 RepID=UPI0035C1C871